MTTNEAAERLFKLLSDGRTTLAQVREGIDEALAEAREQERERAMAAAPETEAVRRCVTHHSCACHSRLANIGRAILDAEAKR